MPRQPKPYVKDGFFCTSTGGVQHRKLCPVHMGPKHANHCLTSLLIQLDHIKQSGGNPADIQLEQASGIVRSAAPGVTYPTVAAALDNFLTHVKSEASGPTYEWYREKLLPVRERYGHLPVNKLTLTTGQQYKTWLREEKRWRRGKKGAAHKGVSPTTVNHHIRAAGLPWLVL